MPSWMLVMSPAAWFTLSGGLLIIAVIAAEVARGAGTGPAPQPLTVEMAASVPETWEALVGGPDVPGRLLGAQSGPGGGL